MSLVRSNWQFLSVKKESYLDTIYSEIVMLVSISIRNTFTVVYSSYLDKPPSFTEMMQAIGSVESLNCLKLIYHRCFLVSIASMKITSHAFGLWFLTLFAVKWRSCCTTILPAS